MPIHLIHYGELGLKGKNRKDFEQRLRNNIAATLKRAGLDGDIESKHRYFLLTTPKDADKQLAEQVLFATFGISWFAEITQLPPDASTEDITKLILPLAEKHQSPDHTFLVDVKRANKQYPMKSPEIEKAIGETIQKETTFEKFQYKNPDHTFHVEIATEGIYVFGEKHRGLGGLPVGSSGRVLLLLSGGIDSAVAAYFLAKRGCKVDFLHFYAQKPTEKGKIARLVQQISQFAGLGTLHIVPYLPFYLAVSDIDTKYELVLFRRFMLKLAESLCDSEGYNAIATGDCLGQVASQTLANLTATGDALDHTLCLRPLLGFDKEEVIKMAKDIGTYEISLEKEKDCCSIVDKHAKTTVKLEKIREEEGKLENYDEIMKETLGEVHRMRVV